MTKDKENKKPLLKRAYDKFKGIKVVQMWIANISLIAFVVSTVFLVLNSTEGFAKFINSVYAGCMINGHSLLDFYAAKIHPLLVFIMPYIFVISVGCFIGVKLLVLAVSSLLRDRYIMDCLGKSVFAEKLYDYLTLDEIDKCIVVTAAWGQGKSYQIKRFLKEFMCYRRNHVYMISCFGIENREQLYELLENEMYCENTSVDKLIFSIFDNIPVVGSFFTMLREQKYTIKRISCKDIVVLEDIERMSPPGKPDEERLNVLAGFVHELIDRYHNKVILVCNIDDFRTNTYQECIYKKLTCEEVTITNEDATIAIMQDCFRQKKISALQMDDMKATLKEKIGDIIVTVLNHAEIRNKRLLQKVFTNEANFIKYARIPNNSVNQEAAKKITVDYLFSYLFWEIVQEKEKEIDEKLMLLLRMNVTIPFPKLYLTVLECMKEVMKKNGSEVSGADWWQTLIYFPRDHYWVGVSALERFSKKTEEISRGQLDLGKWPSQLTNRADADFWQALRAENKQLVDEALADLCTTEKGQYDMLTDGYLFEFYSEKYEYQVSETVRNFIITEYDLLQDSGFTDYADKFFGSTSYEMRGIVDEMIRRREKIIDETDPGADSDEDWYVVTGAESIDNKYESFSKAVNSKTDNVKEPVCSGTEDTE